MKKGVSYDLDTSTDEKFDLNLLTCPWIDAQERNELLRELSALKWHSRVTTDGSTLKRVSQ